MPAHIENRRLVLRAGIRVEHPVDATIAADLTKVIATNGTTSVNVFGASGAPFGLDITEFVVNALDTTAGNITLAVNGNTVATIAKGTTAAVQVGAGSLSNTSVPAGSTVTIVSSSAGNVRARINYTAKGG